MPETKIRIIGGQWRGRKLPVADEDGLRPTGNRMRETLFNWLAPDITDIRCLDAFAGTGALGLEALSRGAESVTFIESKRAVGEMLKKNCELLSANASVHTGDTITWLKQPSHTQYDLVFIDPPFKLDLWQETIQLLNANQWLADDALIYIESPKNVPVETPLNWMIHKDKTNGQVRCVLYKTKII